MSLDIASGAWEARWKAVRHDAEFHYEWGLETAWRARFEEFGYPLEETEQTFSYQGQDVPGRTFSTAGLVLWLPEGATVIGWPREP